MLAKQSSLLNEAMKAYKAHPKTTTRQHVAHHMRLYFILYRDYLTQHYASKHPVKYRWERSKLLMTRFRYNKSLGFYADKEAEQIAFDRITAARLYILLNYKLLHERRQIAWADRPESTKRTYAINPITHIRRRVDRELAMKWNEEHKTHECP
jgi:hypothetical protein